MLKPCQKAEKRLHMDLEESCLVRWAYQIYLTDITEEQATSYLKCWHSGEPESCKNLRTSSFSSTNCLRTLPFDNHLTSKCKRSYLWYACIPSHKTANKQEFNGWALSKFTPFIASYSTECNFCSRSHHAKASLCMYKVHVGTNLLYFSLKAFLVSCQSCCSVCTDANSVYPRNIFCCEISFNALNISLPVHLSESCRQNINSFSMFSLKQYLTIQVAELILQHLLIHQLEEQILDCIKYWLAVVPWCLLTLIQCVALLYY
jgi:hypothetical protein